jgi:four helix bundle protein
MAQYDQLPVFRAAYDLLQEYLTDTKNMPLYLRHTIHQEVVRDLVSVLQNIYRANRYRDKVPYIGKALEQMTEAQLQIRLLKDLHAIALKPYARLSLKSETVLKELAGWKGYSQKS